MSADNFVVIRDMKDGFYWGSFLASFWLSDEMKDKPYPNECFCDGPFVTYESAMQNALRSLPVIEYGFFRDKEPQENNVVSNRQNKKGYVVVTYKVEVPVNDDEKTSDGMSIEEKAKYIEQNCNWVDFIEDNNLIPEISVEHPDGIVQNL